MASSPKRRCKRCGAPPPPGDRVSNRGLCADCAVIGMLEYRLGQMEILSITWREHQRKTKEGMARKGILRNPGVYPDLPHLRDKRVRKTVPPKGSDMPETA